MTKHVIKKNTPDSITVGADNDTWVLNKAATLHVTDAFGFSNDSGFDNVTYEINGKVIVETSVDFYGGIVDSGDNTSVEVGETGVISASRALQFSGQNASVHNEGKITAKQNAISISSDGDFFIENSGHIKGGSYAIGVESASCKVVNQADGVINGKIAFLADDMAVEVVVNKGKISNAGDTVISLSSGDDHLVNRGQIIGDVIANMGDDTIDLRHGTVEGGVHGDAGNDVYIIDDAGMKLVEEMDGGYDTVKSSVSFRLGDNFDNLTLLGSDDINGKGNAETNIIFGNAGNNRLHGFAGTDILQGGAGNDRLFGGADDDQFEFVNGSGKDRIMDFKDGEHIDLRNYAGVGSFSELMIEDNTNGDAVITLTNGDQITVMSVSSGDLGMDDFLITAAAG